jgi:hypothetical protein
MTEDTIRATVSIINEWRGRLTWDALCEALARETGAKYTRQALNNYLDITAAYQAYAKNSLSPLKEKKLNRDQQKIKKLERKISELEMVREALLEKFVRWAVNASTRNLDEDFLDQPLRQITRAENY